MRSSRQDGKLIKNKLKNTCLQHLVKAEDGMLGGAVCSKMPPVVLKRGMTSINTATETSPTHKTSAFLTLQKEEQKLYPTLLDIYTHICDNSLAV